MFCFKSAWLFVQDCCKNQERSIWNCFIKAVLGRVKGLLVLVCVFWVDLEPSQSLSTSSHFP